MEPPLPPIIPQVADDGKRRPFWSVMIPAYNPSKEFLEQTLAGVLKQDPGPEQMQIEVVDDHSPKVDVANLVREIAGARVKVSQTPKNLGLAGCWNTCIERARGEWVHILHQDDLVLPGYYEAMSRAARAGKQFGAAFCRHIFMDSEGHWLFFSFIEQKQAGELSNALERLAEYPRIQTPSIVVRRDVYAEMGGFNRHFTYTLDWEMWCRIAGKYAVWYEPQPLAVYRSHAGSESSRLARDGGNIYDSLGCIDVNVKQLAPKTACRVRKFARNYMALLALDNAWNMVVHREFLAAGAQFRCALAASRSPQVIGKSLGLGWKAGTMVLRRAVRLVS